MFTDDDRLILHQLQRDVQSMMRREGRAMGLISDIATQVHTLTDVTTGMGVAVDAIVAQETDIKAKLDAAIAAGADPVALAAISAELGSATSTLATEKDKIIASTVANTPAAA